MPWQFDGRKFSIIKSFDASFILWLHSTEAWPVKKHINLLWKATRKLKHSIGKLVSQFSRHTLCISFTANCASPHNKPFLSGMKKYLQILNSAIECMFYYLLDTIEIFLCDEKSRIFRRNYINPNSPKICYDGSIYQDILTGDCHPHG